MPTRYGVSPWIDGVPGARRPSHPVLRGEETARVAIIGGGLTGCAIALALATSGIRPVVIEAGRLGQSGAGRHTGLLLPDPGPPFRELQALHGLRAARTVFVAWRRAALDAAALVKRARIRCGLEPCEAVLVAGPQGQRSLRREFDARAAAGVEAGWLADRQARQAIRLETYQGMRLRGGFTLDPYRACLGLAAAAVRRGARIFERSAASAVRPSAKHVEVVTRGGVVRAETVIIATGTATPEFAALRRHFKRRETYAVLTDPVPAAVRAHLPREGLVVRDPEPPRHQIQWATTEHRLLLSGADQDETPEKRRDAVRVQRTGELMYRTLMMFPAISGLKPAYGWELPYGPTADGLPYIGAHRNYPRHLFALGGDGGSITGAFLAARILARTIEDAPQKGDEVFGWTR